ncbi:MAG: 30S ribosomal protein S8e [Thermoprotei archaeon]
MGVWHSNDLVKPSGGRKSSSRKRRRYESGSPPIETILGKEAELIKSRGMGRNYKFKLKVAESINVSDTETGKTVKEKIIGFVSNPSSTDYNRRGVITKGSIVKTKLGLVKVTSRPGRHGILNGILIKQSE